MPISSLPFSTSSLSPISTTIFNSKTPYCIPKSKLFPFFLGPQPPLPFMSTHAIEPTHHHHHTTPSWSLCTLQLHFNDRPQWYLASRAYFHQQTTSPSSPLWATACIVWDHQFIWVNWVILQFKKILNSGRGRYGSAKL